MAKWVITKCDSDNEVGRWELPPGMEDSEIEEILRRLASRDLTELEIINASRRKNDPKRNPFLDRIGVTRPISIGENPYFMATFEKD